MQLECILIQTNFGLIWKRYIIWKGKFFVHTGLDEFKAVLKFARFSLSSSHCIYRGICTQHLEGIVHHDKRVLFQCWLMHDLSLNVMSVGKHRTNLLPRLFPLHVVSLSLIVLSSSSRQRTPVVIEYGECRCLSCTTSKYNLTGLT